jgi:hypothetical protein
LGEVVDAFTWAQTASDIVILSERAGGTTLGAYTMYNITEDDYNYDDFSDQGTDILGASDSILGGSDTFTWGAARDLDSTVIDYGDTATTSFDSFTVSDNHYVSGSISTSNTTGTTTTVTYQDSGVDQDGMYAKRTESSTGDVYSFTNTEPRNDNWGRHRLDQRKQHSPRWHLGKETGKEANRLRLVSSKVTLGRHRADRGTRSAKICLRRALILPSP